MNNPQPCHPEVPDPERTAGLVHHSTAATEGGACGQSTDAHVFRRRSTLDRQPLQGSNAV